MVSTQRNSFNNRSKHGKKESLLGSSVLKSSDKNNLAPLMDVASYPLRSQYSGVSKEFQRDENIETVDH